MTAKAWLPGSRAAQAVRRWLHARTRAGRAAGEDGFILLESMIAITIITIVMSAVGAEFVGGMLASSQQRAQQGAVQVAGSAVEQIRALHASDLLTGRDSSSVDVQFGAAPSLVRPWLAAMDPAKDSAATAGSGSRAAVPTVGSSVTPGTTTYTINQYLGWCSVPASGSTRDCVPSSTSPATSTRYLRAVVAVTWAGQRCASSLCVYVTSTLVSAAADRTFRINAPAYAAPVVVAPAAQTVVVGDTVNLQLRVKDGTGVPSFTWSQSAGALPVGLSVSSTGLISGTVQAPAGSYSATVQVTDAFVRTDTQPVTWTVKPALVLTDPGPQATLVNTAASLTLSATGGAGAPYTYSILSGSLPPGLTLAPATGVISGRPTAVGNYAFVAKVTDASTTRSDTETLTWTVDYPPIAASTPSRQVDTLGNAITPLQLSASGGSGSFVWSDPSNSLPPGLSISRAGVVSGTPTALRSAMSAGNVLYRVNAAGPVLRGSTLPDWTSDSGLVSGGVVKNWGSSLPGDSTVPAGTPAQVFATERYGNQDWNLPVVSGKHLTVRLYFGDQYAGTSQPGQRVFNVAIDGVTKLDHFDVVAAAGYQTGTMRSFDVTSDGDGLDIDLRSISDNAIVDGIEVLDRDARAASGSSGVVLNVTDAASSTRSSTVSFDWAVVARPTVSSPGSSFTTTVGQSVYLGLSSSCPNSPCTYTLDNGPGGLSIDANGIVSGTVGGPPTTYSSTTVTVTDADGATARTTPFTVVVKSPPTVSLGNQTSTVGQTVSVPVTTSCGNGPCSYQLRDAPTGLSIDSSTGVISGTIGGSPGTALPTVTVTDAGGVSATTSSFSWTVKAAPTVSLSNQTSTVGQTVSVPVTTSCPNGPCSYQLRDAPTGLSIDSSTGVISGTIGGSPGTALPVVTVTDAGGVSATTSAFSWTVNARPSLGGLTASAIGETATPSIPISYSCASAPCTITLGGTLASSSIGLGLSAVAVNPSANTVRSLSVGATSGTVYVTGLVSTSAVTTGTSKTYGVSLDITDANGISPTTATATWTAYSTPTISTPGPVATSQNAAASKALTYACPTSSCTVAVSGLPSGIGLTTTSTTTAQTTTSRSVTSSSGTLYLSGRVSASATRTTYPVTVTITSGSTTISSSGVWTVQ